MAIRKAKSAKQSSAARRNLARAHIARTRRKEPRSLGREMRKRTPQSRNLIQRRTR